MIINKESESSSSSDSDSGSQSNSEPKSPAKNKSPEVVKSSVSVKSEPKEENKSEIKEENKSDPVSDSDKELEVKANNMIKREKYKGPVERFVKKIGYGGKRVVQESLTNNFRSNMQGKLF